MSKNNQVMVVALHETANNDKNYNNNIMHDRAAIIKHSINTTVVNF